METVDEAIGGLLLAFAFYICGIIALHAIDFAITWFCSAIVGLLWPFALLASWLWPAVAAITAADATRGVRRHWQGDSDDSGTITAGNE